MDLGNSRILTRKTSSVNMQTGEVIEKEESVLLRTKKRERFMLLYVENFAAIVNLSKRSQEVLARILTKKVTFGTNEAVLDSVFRAELAEQIGSTRQVIANCIAELVQKKILKREKRTGGYLFFLNPYLFGQGEWNTIEKQRQQFTIDYDFINYTAAKEIKTITAYEGIPDKENIQIIKREQYTDDKGVEQHNVFIDTKEDNIIEANVEEIEIDINDETLIVGDKNKEKELNIKELEAKNKEKELNIKELEAKNKEKELNIKELELKLKLEELSLKRDKMQ